MASRPAGQAGDVLWTRGNEASSGKDTGMAKGFLSGVILGAGASLVVAGGLSLATDREPAAAPEPMAVTAPAAPVAPESGEGVAGAQPAADPLPEREMSEAPETPAPDAAPANAAAAPVEAEVGAAQELETAQIGTDDREAAVIAVPAADPDVARPEIPEGAPDAPDTPDAAVAEGAGTTTPAPPAVSDAPEAPEALQPDSELAALAPGDPTPERAEAGAAAPDAPAQEAKPTLRTEPAEPPAAAPDAPAQAAEPTPRSEPAVAAEPAGTASDPELDESDRLAERAGSLIDRTPAVRESRLPSIGAPDPEDAPEEEPDPLPAALATLPPDSPLARNAELLDVAPDVPRMAVILIDDGSGPLGPEALEAFPFPVSFAIAPGHPDPAGTAAEYRKLGFEVLVIGTVPEGAQASDVEVSLAGLVGSVPQAVAVLEAPSGGLQGSREVSEQVSAFLAASGHGLVMMPKGLNTAQKLAAKAGVPSVSLFRDFDGEGQTASAIRRTLDQATFRARQEGAVVMLGRLRADTISALVLWGLQDRSASIELVPVSTVLTESLGSTE